MEDQVWAVADEQRVSLWLRDCCSLRAHPTLTFTIVVQSEHLFGLEVETSMGRICVQNNSLTEPAPRLAWKWPSAIMLNASLVLTVDLSLPGKTIHTCGNAMALWLEGPGHQLMDSRPSQCHTVLPVGYFTTWGQLW